MEITPVILCHAKLSHTQWLIFYVTNLYYSSNIYIGVKFTIKHLQDSSVSN